MQENKKEDRILISLIIGTIVLIMVIIFFINRNR
jgi:hypothetical protein